MNKKYPFLVVALAVFVFMGAGCNTTSQNTNSTAEGSSAVETTHIDIQGFTFNPVQVKVKKGATVSVTNKDSVPHSATADNGSFDTGLMNGGETKTITFNTAGTFNYHCSAHPSMQATIIVE